jgi:hypothetical protein
MRVFAAPAAAKPHADAERPREIRMKSPPVSAAQVRAPASACSSQSADIGRERFELRGGIVFLVNMIFSGMRLPPSDKPQANSVRCLYVGWSRSLRNESALLCGWYEMRAPLGTRHSFIAVS